MRSAVVQLEAEHRRTEWLAQYVTGVRGQVRELTVYRWRRKAAGWKKTAAAGKTGRGEEGELGGDADSSAR